MHVEKHLSVEQLEELVRREKSARVRDRKRAVLLAARGEAKSEITRKIGRSKSFVESWVARYNVEGPRSFLDRPRPGQPTKLRRSDEAAFLARVEAGPTEADGVCALRGPDFVRILREEFGAAYSEKSIYDLLCRLGLSSLQPRPAHEKADPEAQRQWLEEAPLFSAASASGPGAGRSSSSSRTRPASDRRAS